MMKAQDIGVSLCGGRSVHFCFTSMSMLRVLNVLVSFKDGQKTLAPPCGVEE